MRVLKTVLVLSALFLFTVPAEAYVLWIDWPSGELDSFTATFRDQSKGYYAGAASTYLAPGNNVTFPPGNPEGAFIGYTWCLDLDHVVSDPDEYLVTPMLGGGNWNQANTPRPANSWGRVAWLLNTYGATADTGAKRAGMAVALWKATYENDFAYVSGLAPQAETAYNTYYTAYLQGQTADNFRWYDAANDGTPETGGQDMGSPVPEPASLLLLSVGLLGAGSLGRRKLRKV